MSESHLRHDDAGALPVLPRPSGAPSSTATLPVAGAYALRGQTSSVDAVPAARAARVGLSELAGEGDVELDVALRAALAAGASDLHLTVGAPPTVRVDGALEPLEGYPVLAAE